MFKLPEGFKDLLPDEAEVFYFVQQKLYESFLAFGYKPVITSSVEFLKTYILSGEEESHVFNFIDHYENKTACFRFDFTPQIVRIISSHKDFHQNLPIRICYFGSVLRNPANFFANPREIHHAGVELIGIEDIKAEQEILLLINEIAKNLNLKKEIKMYFNDNEILRKLLNKSGLYKNLELKQAMIYRDISKIEKIVSPLNVDKSIKRFIIELPLLCGDKKLLKDIQRKYPIPLIMPNINKLIQLSEFINSTFNNKIYFDLGEVRGLEYHTGIVFDGYLEDNSGKMKEIITGGRYNKLLKQFGINNASATGFAIDIISLSNCIHLPKNLEVALVTGNSDMNTLIKIAQFLQNSKIRVTLLTKMKKEELQKNRFDYILILEDNINLSILDCKNKETKKLALDKFFKSFLQEFFDYKGKE